MAHSWTLPDWTDYRLLDCGDGWKVEEFAGRILLRPETVAVWPLAKPLDFWERKADARFEFTSKKTGKWHTSPKFPDRWTLRVPESCGGFRMNLELTAFKHVGIFPEQASNWAFITEQLQGKPEAKVLNLFAYTGGASLAAKAAGADVTHVDSIKQVINWTRENMESSGLEGIRWVVEDALKFMQREVRRGNRYTGIIMDPPTWGLGAKGEKWRLEDQINTLFQAAAELLEPDHFLVVSTYSGLTPTMVESLAARHLGHSRGEGRELVLHSDTGVNLPLGNTLRVSS
jgi:23S rRNA (cytosine1962-C5)-methyltransferase